MKTKGVFSRRALRWKFTTVNGVVCAISCVLAPKRIKDSKQTDFHPASVCHLGWIVGGGHGKAVNLNVVLYFRYCGLGDALNIVAGPFGINPFKLEKCEWNYFCLVVPDFDAHPTLSSMVGWLRRKWKLETGFFLRLRIFCFIRNDLVVFRVFAVIPRSFETQFKKNPRQTDHAFLEWNSFNDAKSSICLSRWRRTFGCFTI